MKASNERPNAFKARCNESSLACQSCETRLRPRSLPYCKEGSTRAKQHFAGASLDVLRAQISTTFFFLRGQISFGSSPSPLRRSSSAMPSLYAHSACALIRARFGSPSRRNPHTTCAARPVEDASWYPTTSSRWYHGVLERRTSRSTVSSRQPSQIAHSPRESKNTLSCFPMF